jgi:hypothetical protein
MWYLVKFSHLDSPLKRWEVGGYASLARTRGVSRLAIARDQSRYRYGCLAESLEGYSGTDTTIFVGMLPLGTVCYNEVSCVAMGMRKSKELTQVKWSSRQRFD